MWGGTKKKQGTRGTKRKMGRDNEMPAQKRGCPHNKRKSQTALRSNKEGQVRHSARLIDHSHLRREESELGTGKIIRQTVKEILHKTS